jgi:Gpi18-like mannosyltransferase/predicted membrane-bound dolichyl-phosphate-mannose-protein mannosyltransferase
MASAAILLFARTVAWAAGGVATPSDGRLAGYVASLTIALVIGYALYLCLRPLTDRPDSGLLRALLILIAIWVLKQSVLPLFPGFGVDVGSYQAWAHRVGEVGPAGTYRAGYFLDYPPGYLYALWFVGAIGELFRVSGEAFRQLVEAPALVGDFLLALAVFAYLRRSTGTALAYAGMLMVALNPGMLFDSVVWGQSDSVPTLLIFLSLTSVLEGEFELAWALAAVGVLVKPQVLLFVPVLGLWTLIKGDFEQWWRSALAFVAMGAIIAMPFQISHPWSWLPALYQSTAGYYHETSVNAFNLMELLAGLRAPDETHILGVPCFALGMTLLAGVYALVAWKLWRSASPKTLFYCTFAAVFGSFMLAPRMHERYLYPALVFIVPLAIEDPMMLGVLAVSTATLLFNLAYIKRTLESPKVFLDSRDALAMVASAINMVGLGMAASFGLRPAPPAEEGERAEVGIQALIGRLREASSAAEVRRPEEPEAGAAIPWLRIDTIVIAALVVTAAATRLWRLGLPAEIVFDEVHFVGQARHYLHGESFLDPHPPLAKLLIAMGIALFGDHPWSWRISNATLGIALVGVTYLLGRRMFHSRLGAALAAAFVLGDGMFLVDSRVAVLDIVYITFAACAYLTLFRFFETANPFDRRKTLLWMGLALGACLGSKLYIPAVTFLLVTGFLIYHLWEPAGPALSRRSRWNADSQLYRRVGGAVLLTGAISAAVYIAIFLPHFLLGWWGGIADLVKYYGDVAGYERSVASATHPYSAPWWSWPLMLRPIAYWQNFPNTGKVSTIWGGGNPATWWAGLTAIAIITVQAFERRSWWRPFVVIGYLGYLGMWIPIGRTLFLYHYMGSVYLAYLALGAVLAECWNDGAQPWEQFALLLTLAPVFVLGLPAGWGIAVFLALVGGYGATLLQAPRYAGKFTCAAVTAVALVMFFYYFPIWVAMPIERAGYYSRMWLQGPGLRSWI